MWINPKYADRYPDAGQAEATAEPPTRPPAETGRRILALPRKGRDGSEDELRVSLDAFEGHPYISIRLWMLDRRSGAWWPTKKGLSIRMREAGDVADAIREALRLADAEEGRPREADGIPTNSMHKSFLPDSRT